MHAAACCVMLHRPCPWIRDGGTAGGKGLDGIISGWMKGGFDEGMDGWMEGRGRLLQGLIKGRQIEGNNRKEKRTMPVILFSSLNLV